MGVNGSTKIINSKVLDGLLRLAESTKRNVAEAAGALGGKLTHHFEHSNLDRVAWGMIKSLDGRDPDRRARALAHFDAMREGLERAGGRWADAPTHLGDLVEMSEQEADEAAQEAATQRKAEEAAADSDANAAKVNAAKIRNGIKPTTPEQEEAAKSGRPVRVGSANTKTKAKGMPSSTGVAH